MGRLILPKPKSRLSFEAHVLLPPVRRDGIWPPWRWAFFMHPQRKTLDGRDDPHTIASVRGSWQALPLSVSLIRRCGLEISPLWLIRPLVLKNNVCADKMSNSPLITASQAVQTKSNLYSARKPPLGITRLKSRFEKVRECQDFQKSLRRTFRARDGQRPVFFIHLGGKSSLGRAPERPPAKHWPGLEPRMHGSWEKQVSLCAWCSNSIPTPMPMGLAAKATRPARRPGPQKKTSR